MCLDKREVKRVDRMSGTRLFLAGMVLPNCLSCMASHDPPLSPPGKGGIRGVVPRQAPAPILQNSALRQAHAPLSNVPLAAAEVSHRFSKRIFRRGEPGIWYLR